MTSPWTESKVVPDVLTSAPPAQLKVAWGAVKCSFNTCTPTQMQDEPTIDFEFEKGAFYTVIMTDPDAPSRAEPTFGQWLHWLRVNVTADSAGEVLAKYVGCGAPKGTGLHRYVFLVYKQSGECDASALGKLGKFHMKDERPKWNAEAFVGKIGGCTLVAGTFCEAEWDEYVPTLYAKLDHPSWRPKIKRKNWLPLESNPDLLNKYIHALGVPDRVLFHEVYGVDEGLLAMVPQPVLAVLMLFPISDASEKHRHDEEKKVGSTQTTSKDVFYVKQEIGNACGTIGLIHAILNNADRFDLDPEKFFAKFLAETKGLGMPQRVQALNANTDIEVEHQALASEARSDVQHASNANLHFNAFIECDGDLYELDGRKERPINHGPCSNLLHDAGKVAKQFMARDPDEIRFNLVALGIDN